MKIFLQLFWFFKSQWQNYILGMFCIIAIAIAELIPAKIIGGTIDKMTQNQLTQSELLYSCLVILAMALIIYLCRIGWRIALIGPSFRLAILLREKLLRHFLKLDAQFYQRRSTGDLMAHATNDVQAVESTAGEGIVVLFDCILASIIILGAMIFWIDWRLTLVTLLPFIAFFYASKYISREIHQGFSHAQEAFSDLNKFTQERLNGMRAVKAHAMHQEQLLQFNQLSDDAFQAKVRVAKAEALFEPAVGICVGVAYFLAFAFGSYLVVQDSITIGELTAFSIYVGKLVLPMAEFGWLFAIVEKGHASQNRIENLLNEEAKVANSHSLPHDKAVTQTMVNALEDITPKVKENKSKAGFEMQLTDFTYPGAAQSSLSDLWIHIPIGSITGLAGQTGAGKSTLLKVLLRQFELEQQSQITWQQQDIRQWPIEQYRALFAVVPQEPLLFSMTIAENIAFASPGASQDAIEQAARVAHIHEDILKLPHGYATQVGEKGINLSGGQKQRITLARAILSDRPILVLDDAFASLDVETESNIVSNLKNLTNKTVIMSSHRLLNLRLANQILVLKDGKPLEIGQHQELIQSNNWYAKIYQQQLEQAKTE